MVYFIQEAKSGCVKIGKAKNVRTRLSDLQVGNPNLLAILATIPDTPNDVPYHMQFQTYRARGEWFNPSSELMAFISGLPRSDKSVKPQSNQKPVPLSVTAVQGSTKENRALIYRAIAAEKRADGVMWGRGVVAPSRVKDASLEHAIAKSTSAVEIQAILHAAQVRVLEEIRQWSIDPTQETDLETAISKCTTVDEIQVLLRTALAKLPERVREPQTGFWGR